MTGPLTSDSTRDQEFFTLISMCVEEDGMADRAIASAKGGGGLEAWRLILGRYDPDVMTHGFSKIDRLLNPERSKTLKDVIPNIDDWQTKVAHLRGASEIAMFNNDTLKKFTLRKIVTTDLEAHLQTFGHSIDTYAKALAEIHRYVEEKAGTTKKDRPTPMQVDHVHDHEEHQE